MPRRLSRLCLVILLALPACSSQSPEAVDPLVDRLDPFIRHELADKEIPNLAIAVVDDQEIIWSNGYGFADDAGTRPVTDETVYRVASVSKLFTALTVMKLVERGELDLDEPITTYLPDFQPENPFGTPITLRQLHSHRSGLVREPPVGHYFDPTEPSLEEMVASLNETRLIYPPKTRTKYSNAAVSVAGRILEVTQGAPYEEVIRREVIDPLGLQRSSFSPRPDLREALSVGYMWTYDGRRFEAPVFELGIGPAANLYTTMSDLARFMSGLFAIRAGAEGIVSAATLDSMWTPQFVPPGTDAGYGIGFFVSDFEGERRVQHAGVMYGYATRVYALPDQQLGVAVVANLDAVNPVVDRIGEFALSLLLAQRRGTPLPEAEITTPIDSVFARALDGTYAGPGTLRLQERNGTVLLDNGTEKRRLRALGDTLVVDSRLGYGLRVQAAGDTLITEDGQYVRRPEPLPPPPNPDWDGLIGEYGWDHNTLYILERGGQLTALIEWFFEYPLQHVTDDVYLFPDDGLYMGERLVFTRDADGRATQANMEGVVWTRRPVGPEAGNVFQIEPLAPVDQLREAALAAAPPIEDGPFRTPDLVELSLLDPTLQLDVRYATDRNFMGTPFYAEGRAFLQRPAAEALVRAHEALRAHGLGIRVFDGYRPWYVTKMFWDATPDSLRIFVADPASGSRHNRGCAVDIGLFDRSTGQPVTLTSGYDEFTARAYPEYPGGTSRERYYRELLRDVMEEAGFTVYEAEWWHFDYKDWRSYPLMNVTFDQIAGPAP